ncbi:MAG: hypothetical protein JSS72_08910 [Armatimonadetes bacterium]|nr:hypothetical protein [Armatimonadota bacterium]
MKSIRLMALSFACTGFVVAQVVQKDAAPAAPPADRPQSSQSSTDHPSKTQSTQLPTVSYTRTVKDSQAKPAQKPVVPAGPTKAWREFHLNKTTRLYLDFNEANPVSVFTMLSKASGITILKDPNFKQKLTVITGKEVSLDTAFDTVNSVLNFSGYEFHKRGDLLFVERIPPPPIPPMPSPPAQPDTRPISKVYRLEHASAAQVTKIVNDVFGAATATGGAPTGGMPGGMTIINGQPVTMGGQPQGAPAGMSGGGPGGQQGGPGENAPVKATSDDYGNNVIVLTSPQRQDKVAALIKELDKPADNQFETQIFQLKHVTVDEALPAVKDVLKSLSPLGRGFTQDQPATPTFSFFRQPETTQKGAQSAIGVAQTNSIIVTATKANLAVIEKLVDSLDSPTMISGSVFVVPVLNAKASDLASILQESFKQRPNTNRSPFFFFFDDNPNEDKKPPSDIDERGNVVNVRDLAGKVTITADPNTNSLLVNTLPSNMPFVRRVIEQLDRVTDQVVIETIIAEVTLDKDMKLGAEWSFLQNKAFGSSSATGSGSQSFGLNPGSGTPLQGFSYTLKGANYSAFLHALETDQRFHVLSTPSIFASNNVKSEINVSQKVPYITNQQNNGTTTTFSYDFLDVGVVLDVTPRVSSNNSVSMDVKQTANELQSFTSFNAPVINNRSATTTVTVPDGETVVLGGIIRTSHSIDESKIPILGDIPLLGNLFKSKEGHDIKTELMVFLTPHIVRTGADLAKIRENLSRDLSKNLHSAIDEKIKNREELKPKADGGGGKG